MRPYNICLCLAYLTKGNAFKIHLCHEWQHFLLSSGWVVFHFVSMCVLYMYILHIITYIIYMIYLISNIYNIMYNICVYNIYNFLYKCTSWMFYLRVCKLEFVLERVLHCEKDSDVSPNWVWILPLQQMITKMTTILLPFIDLYPLQYDFVAQPIYFPTLELELALWLALTNSKWPRKHVPVPGIDTCVCGL